MINNQLIKELAKNSVDEKNNINEKVAEFILKNLSKKELKIYLRRIRKISKEQNVTVKYEGKLNNNLETEIRKMFEDKIIKFEKDEKLGGGFLIINNDMIVNYTIDRMIESRIKII